MGGTLRRRTIALGLAWLGGCRTTDEPPVAGSETSAGESVAHEVSGTPPTTDTADVGPTTTVTTSGTTSDDAATTADTTATTGEATTGEPYVSGCPAPWPAEWVACEDFEDITDPWAALGNFIDNGGRITIANDEGLDGSAAMSQRFDPGNIFSGRVDIRFGAGPQGGTVHSPRGHYEELWLRVFWRFDETWTGQGWGDLVELESLDPLDTIAYDGLTIVSEGMSLAYPWTCITGDQLLCSGSDQWGDPDMRALGQWEGASGPYAAEGAGTWHCSVVHVRANTLGEADGSMDLHTDGNLDFDIGGLDLRGSWNDYGLNAARFNAWWDTVPAVTHRYFDDVVVSQAPLVCP
jgi:hypothetical protein